MNWTDLLNRAMELSNVIVNKYGPVAWETMLTLKRIEGIANLFYGLKLITIGVVIVTLVYWIGNKIASTIDNEIDKLCCRFIPTGIALAIMMAVCIGPGLMWLTSIWNWIAVFYPELAIAHDIMTKVIQ